VSLVLFSGDAVPLGTLGRADAQGDVAFSERIPPETAPGTYVAILEGPSRAKGSAALRVVAAAAAPPGGWTTDARFAATGNQDTAAFATAEGSGRLVWAHSPRASSTYLFVVAGKTGAPSAFDPVVSSWRPESGEWPLSGVGRYALRVVSDGSDW